MGLTFSVACGILVVGGEVYGLTKLNICVYKCNFIMLGLEGMSLNASRNGLVE